MTPSKIRLKNDPLWYKDAIIYELHVKSFSDSKGDGMGDFRGLINKIPYLHNLGITAIWLLPFYPSPLRDDGYDIADYHSINPDYGTMADFKEFLKVAHSHGIRVITELVINHTSDQHPWFQRARSAKEGSAWRNFYVWNKTPEKYSDARIIFNDFETSNWTWDPVAKSYYWHRFYHHQPDLNYESKAVQKEIIKVMDFWFGMGVDGMRLDAVPYLYEEEGTNCENLPKTHAFLKKLRAHVDAKHKNKMFLCEANQWPEDVAEYFGEGDECQMSFHFPLMPRLFMSLWMEESFPIVDILEQTPAIPENCQWAIFLRNHDELTLEMVTDEERDYMYKVYARDMKARINMGIKRRLAPLLGKNRRKIELMNMLLFSLPGTSVIYYGDELGMGDNYYLGDRNGVRTPMQWSPDRNAGFSSSNPHKLFLPVIIDPEYHYEAVNVENQESNESSLLWWTKRLIIMRKRFKAFSRGSFEIAGNDNSKILSFVRKFGDEIVLVVVNLSRFAQVVNLNLPEYAGYTPIEIFSGNEFPQIKDQPYLLTPSLHHCYWFQLKKEEKKEEFLEEKLPEMKINSASCSALLDEEHVAAFEKNLQSYVKKCRWFGGKGKRMRGLKISHIMPISLNENCAKILFMDISYSDGQFETYVLPVTYIKETEAVDIVKENPNAAILSVELSDEKRIVIDAVYEVQFRSDFVKLFGSRKKIKKSVIEISPKRGRKFFQAILKEASMSESTVLKAEQSNTSIIYGNTHFVKLFRKIDEGVNPDVEIGEFLGEETKFENTPQFLASLSLLKKGKFYGVLGLMQEFTANQGNAWDFTLEELSKYYEKVLAKKNEIPLPDIPTIFDKNASEVPTELTELFGVIYFEMAELLGKRTGQMHMGLASSKSKKDFVPENFSKLYQRSVYQSMLGLVKKTLLSANVRSKDLPKEFQDDIKYILDNKSQIMKIFQVMLSSKFLAKKIRIHGDYHLGQVLFTGKDFVVVDFEGEPSRTLSERRIKRSALRDVAGMLRSFHYAAYGSFILQPNYTKENIELLQSWAELWYSYVGGIFLKSYLNTVKGCTFMPSDPLEIEKLLKVFIMEKAVYELDYELNNRPDWLFIPLKGIESLLQSSGFSE